MTETLKFEVKLSDLCEEYVKKFAIPKGKKLKDYATFTNMATLTVTFKLKLEDEECCEYPTE
jgi:hypothetical protein